MRTLENLRWGPRGREPRHQSLLRPPYWVCARMRTFRSAPHRNLHGSGFKVAIVNPLRSRKFAEAIGTLAKTDRVDARMMAIMGESLTPDAIAPPPELIEDLQELARGPESFADARPAGL